MTNHLLKHINFKALRRCKLYLLISGFLILQSDQLRAQVTNWVGDVSTDFFNKENWSDNTIDFTALDARTLVIGAGSPNACIHTGGNSTYRPGKLNTSTGGNLTVNGIIYPWASDNLNGTLTVNSPADLNIRSYAYIAKGGNATVTINGGVFSSKYSMNLSNASGNTATVTIKGGAVYVGTDLNVANGTGYSATLNISGGSVNVTGNLNIGTSGSIAMSGAGLIKMTGDKRTVLNNYLTAGKITYPSGRTMSVTYDGTYTTCCISLITESSTYITLYNEYVEAKIDKATSNITSLKVNGIETLNTNTSTTRRGTYYDFTTSAGFETIGGCTFSIKRNEVDLIDVSFKRPYTPGTNVTPCDADIHYVLKKGDTGIYTYSILEHQTTYPAFDLGSWRQVMWIASDPNNSNNYLCERIYVDSLRNWQMPSLYDFSQASSTSIAEIVKLNTGVQSGGFDGKYEYCSPSFWEDLCYGHSSNVNGIGSWFVYGSPEFFNEGPTYHDLNAAAGIIHSCMNTVHYNTQGFTVPQGEYWTKIYGPYLIYTSTKSTGAANWADAKARVVKEKAEWPYSWLTNTTQYPLASGRGTITGKFIINDPLKPAVTGKNAWVGVTILSNALNQWQMEEKNYQYWVKTDASGNFTIKNVRPGTYSFFGYSNGAVGEYSQANVSVTAGGTTALGNVTWNIARDNGSLVWEIGVANRTADEYKFGHKEYMQGFAYETFYQSLASPIEYNVANNNWSTALPYAHCPYRIADGSISSWKWRLNFTLPANTVLTGNALLTIAYAGSDHAQQWIYVNNENSLFTSYYPENGGGNTMLRQANYGKYSYKKISIPMSKLKIGANTITLLMPSSSALSNHIMYDYISLEAVLPAGSQTASAPNSHTALNLIDDQPGSEEVLVYPNPTTDKFKLSLNNKEEGTITISIINAAGLTVKTITATKSGQFEKEISVEGLPAGVYYVKTAINSFTATKSILIH